MEDVRKYIGNRKYNQRYQKLGKLNTGIKCQQRHKNVLVFAEDAFQAVSKTKTVYHAENQGHKINK